MKQFLLLAVWQLAEADWAFGTPFFIATTMCMISLHPVQTFLHLSTKPSSWFVLIFVAFTRVLSVWPSSSRSTTVANRTAGEQLAGQLESTRQVWGVIHSLQLVIGNGSNLPVTHIEHIYLLLDDLKFDCYILTIANLRFSRGRLKYPSGFVDFL